MRDFLKNVPLIVILFVVVTIVRAIAGALKAKSAAQPGVDESEDQRRVREIQERIRRIAAERSGQRAPGQPPPLLRPAAEAPAPRRFEAPSLPPIDTFGGPARRAIATFERRTPPPIPAPSRNAELERQEQLQEEMRVLDEKKMLTARHQAYDARARTEAAQSESGLRATAREKVLEDLRDPSSVRRAFVLREVLGPPVALR